MKYTVLWINIKILARPNVLFFEGFQPQNVLIFLFFVKYSYLLTAKITPDFTLEECKILYPDYIAEDDFDGVQIILLWVNI